MAGAIASLALIAGVGATEAVWGAVAEPATAGATSSDGATGASVTHVARPGDTLWSIADVYRGDVERSAYVDALVRLNDGAGIVVGQSILLP